MLSWLILASIVVGIIICVYSLAALKNEEPSSSNIDMENLIKAIDKSVEEADNAIEEMNNLSQGIMSEISAKYNELLYLYNLIDTKQKEAGTVDLVVNDSFNQPEAYTDSAAGQFNSRFSINNPKYNEIIELDQEGLSVADIARTLDIGQGEVKLVLELGKGR